MSRCPLGVLGLLPAQPFGALRLPGAANRRTSWDRKADKRDWSAFNSGYAKGKEVSIDQQAGSTKVAGMLK